LDFYHFLAQSIVLERLNLFDFRKALSRSCRQIVQLSKTVSELLAKITDVAEYITALLALARALDHSCNLLDLGYFNRVLVEWVSVQNFIN
jgi:hypothetical protein